MKALQKSEIPLIRKFRAPGVMEPTNARISPNDTLPLDLEIGSGVGLFAIHRALQHPDRRLIAIERSKMRFEKFQRRISNHAHLENLQAYRADAVFWIAGNLRKESVDRIFLLYPNPYPKQKQANLRWHRMPFFERLLEVLKPGGQIFMRTNLLWYAEEAEQYLRRLWAMQTKASCIQEDWSIGLSHFERKYLRQGEACFEIEATKTVSP